MAGWTKRDEERLDRKALRDRLAKLEEDDGGMLTEAERETLRARLSDRLAELEAGDVLGDEVKGDAVGAAVAEVRFKQGVLEALKFALDLAESSWSVGSIRRRLEDVLDLACDLPCDPRDADFDWFTRRLWSKLQREEGRFRLQDRRRRAVEMAHQGSNWSKVYKQLHLDKLPEQDRESIRQTYEQTCARMHAPDNADKSTDPRKTDLVTTIDHDTMG
jgi:hypothetical protein